MARLSALVLVVLIACSASGPVGPDGDGQDGITLETVVTGLSNPLFLTAPPGDDRLFIVEQPGRIRIVRDGELLATPFLDLTARVRSGGERGLLGLAFHPEYASNGAFYVNYTDSDGDTRIERFTVSSQPDVADAGSASPVLAVGQPFSNHNGGMLAFGPDGMLYVGLGDGGSGGDPQGNGQDRGRLLGSLLRIDVDGGSPYTIPGDNPFVGTAGARAEIWAYGLRNPWRFSFDRTAGTIYIADVGQNRYEEVNVAAAAAAGLNYGWNLMEGAHCFTSGCDPSGLVLPALEYTHGEGCSVTGGYVYRGATIPEIVGHYLYGDYCGGWVRSFRWSGGDVTDERAWDLPSIGNILSFGEDAAGELYVLSSNGTVYRLAAEK